MCLFRHECSEQFEHKFETVRLERERRCMTSGWSLHHFPPSFYSPQISKSAQEIQMEFQQTSFLKNTTIEVFLMNKLPRACFNLLWVKRSILRKCATADVTHRNDEQRQKWIPPDASLHRVGSTSALHTQLKKKLPGSEWLWFVAWRFQWQRSPFVSEFTLNVKLHSFFSHKKCDFFMGKSKTLSYENDKAAFLK